MRFYYKKCRFPVMLDLITSFAFKRRDQHLIEMLEGMDSPLSFKLELESLFSQWGFVTL